MQRVPFHILALLVLFCATSSAYGDHTKDSLDVLQKNLTARKALLVDVREHKETDKGYVDGAVLVPLSLLNDGQESDEFRSVLAQRLPAKKIIYLYCQSGSRCLAAAKILDSFGYDTRPLKQGFADLKREGFVVSKPKKQ